MIEHFGANPKIVALGLSVLQNISSGEIDETVKHKLTYCVLNAMAKHITMKVGRAIPILSHFSGYSGERRLDLC